MNVAFVALSYEYQYILLVNLLGTQINKAYYIKNYTYMLVSITQADAM